MTIAMNTMAALLAGLALSGCASLDATARFAPLQAQTQALLGKDLQWARDADQRQALDGRVAELLRGPLSLDSAQQIALLNHRGLQAGLHRLGIADAELVQASRLPNPGFSLGRQRRGDEREIERGLHLNLLNLLTRAPEQRLAGQRLQQVQQDLTLQVLAVAAEARRSYLEAVAARQLAHYSRQVMDAAEASAELARRMTEVGNFNKLRQAREQGFYADAALALARAEGEAMGRREALIRALGLWGDQLGLMQLPERLPDLPEAPRELPEVEHLAITQRLDVQAARAAAALSAEQLGLRTRTRFLNVLELGLARNSSNEAPTQRGFELSLELPLFDWGEARVAHAQGLYMEALERTAHQAVLARSEAREAYWRYRSAHEIAWHHTREIVPNRKRISDENLLRYNGMLIGVFELLADARAQITAVAAAIAAQRDFFIAESQLDQALLGPVRLDAPRADAATAESGSAGH